MTKAELAKTAATAVAPELAVPVEAALAIAQRLREKPPTRTMEARGDVVLVPPPERALLIQLKKQRVRVVVRRGVRIVTVDPARGLTTTETIVAGTLVAAGYGVYVAAKAVNADVKALNPASWFGGGNPIVKKLGL